MPADEPFPPHSEGLPRLHMDPRFRERRVELQRSSGRRRLRLLVAGLCVVATLGGAVAVLHSPIVRVRHLDLTGAVQVTKAEVAAAAGVGPSTPMVDVNVGRATESLDALPWVSRAVVHRDWPGTLDVSLVERVPVAQVSTGGGRWGEVDVTGRVLATSDAAFLGLVKLEGFGKAGAPGSVLSAAGSGLRVAADMPGPVRTRVTSMVSESGGDVSLTLARGGNVELGSPTEISAKMESLSTMLTQVDLTGLQTIDEEVPEAPTLTRS